MSELNTTRLNRSKRSIIDSSQIHVSWVLTFDILNKMWHNLIKAKDEAKWYPALYQAFNEFSSAD